LRAVNREGISLYQLLLKMLNPMTSAGPGTLEADLKSVG
jgi:hypothetical protein